MVSPFVRTPKQGAGVGSYKAAATTGVGELLCSLWAIVGIGLSFAGERPWVTPLLLIYASGFAWVAILQMKFYFQVCANERQSVKESAPWTMVALVMCGLFALACYINLADLGYWRQHPVEAAWSGLGAGIAYLIACLLVLKPKLGRWHLAAIIGFALAFRVAAFGIPVSDDLNRYIVEGKQMAYGHNPYIHAPADEVTRQLLNPEVLDERILAGVNHPEWTAIYPPVTLYFEMLVSHIDSRLIAMNVAFVICELLALAFIAAILLRLSLPLHYIALAAWNPLGPIWFAGEGHNDSLMALLIAFAIWLGIRGRERGRVVAMSLAALAKPFAVWMLLPSIDRLEWKWLAVPPLIALLCYLPFIQAGTGVLSSFGRFGGELHFHGVLYPLYQLLLSFVLPQAILGTGVVLALVATLIYGSVIIFKRSNDEAGHVGLTGNLLLLLLICLPTMHPWYAIPLVCLLPIYRRSIAAFVWTAMMPVYWLHGIAMQKVDMWTEDPWVTTLAHTPMLLLIIWEIAGRPGLPHRFTAKKSPELVLQP